MTFRQGLMLFTACGSVLCGLSLASAWAQAVDPTVALSARRLDPHPLGEGNTQSNVRLQMAQNTGPSTATSPSGAVPSPAAAPGGGVDPSANSIAASGDEAIADVVIKKRALLLKQKDVPSGITEIGPREIESVAHTSSVQSLLQQSAPSVNVYQSGLGQDVPVISVRGVRGAELAQTLDGVPTQDLIYGGSGAYLSNNISAPFVTEQIDGVTVRPGVAPPGVQGFGTIGGTLAYNSKRPTDTRYFDVFSGIGSYGTDYYGIEFNSGEIPGTDGLKTMLRYDRGESAGYIDNTQAKYRDVYFAADKPYANGLSNLSATVIYNQGDGYLQPGPIAVPLAQQYGQFYNYGKDQAFLRQDNSFLTTILSDDTYVNDWLKVGGKAFYIRAEGDQTSFNNTNLIGADQPYQPNFHVPFFAYGQIGPGTRFSNKQYFNYDPSVFGNPTGNDANGNPGNTPQGFGQNAQAIHSVSQTYGIKPEVNLFLPYNNIRVGALITREQRDSQTFFFGQIPVPRQPGYNLFAQSYTERQLYEGYIQDRIDLFHNTLHIEPGFSYEGAGARNEMPFSYSSKSTLPNRGYTVKRFDREALPYIGVSYDLPYVKNVTAYASWGRSTLFAPVSDFTLGTSGTTQAPGPERLTAVEVGLKYNTDRLYLNVDYFNQRVTRAFGFFTNYLTGQQAYGNGGIEEFKGFEIAGKYKVTPEIGIFGSGSHLLAKYLQSYAASTTVFNDQFGYAFKGDPISGVPDFTASYGVDYDKKNIFKNEDEAYLRFFGVYTGQQYTTYDLDPNPAVNPDPTLQAATVTNKGFKLSAYNIFNLSFKYSLPLTGLPIKKLDFLFNVQNLFNQSYKAYFYNQYVSYAGVYGGAPYSNFIPGAPTVVLFGVSARF